MGGRTAVGFLAVGLALSLVPVVVPPAASAAGAAPSSPCALSPSATKPVNITFWNSMLQANQSSIATLTKAFNASQDRVHVNLVQYPSDEDLWTSYLTAHTTHSAPQLVELEDYRTQSAADSKFFVPVQRCLQATGFPTGGLLASALGYFRVGGSQLAMPFAVSEPVLIYNKAAFVKAGLDPNDPPATLSAYLADARVLKEKGMGTGLVLDPGHVEAWLATANQLLVNARNGRAGRPTRAAFDNGSGRQLFGQLDQLVRSGDAVTNPSSGPDAVDNLLGIGTGKYGMTLETSSALGSIFQVLKSGAFPGVQLGVAPFPTLGSPERGGVGVGGIALYLSAGLPAPQQAAAWDYITYLESTKVQAFFAAETGYLPVRRAAVNNPLVQSLWAEEPGYRVAWQELESTPAKPATTGALIGPYDSVRQAILSAEQAMFAGTMTPTQALGSAARAVDGILQDYNTRLGV